MVSRIAAEPCARLEDLVQRSTRCGTLISMKYAAFLLVLGCCNDRSMALPQNVLLDELVKSEPGPAFTQLLRRHGPILPEQTDFLLEKAKDSSPNVRTNASKLLLLVRSQEKREAALRKLAGETDDARVFAIVASGLADGKTLAAKRSDLILKALRASDSQVVSAAIRLAWLADLPGITEDMARKLDDPDDKVRFAAAKVLAEAGCGPLGPRLRAILLDPGQRTRYPLEAIYSALSHSEDPTTGEAFRTSLVGADMTAELSLINAIHASPSRQPWLRSLLLELASHDGRVRWQYFDTLADWQDDAPTAELVKISIDHLEKLSKGDVQTDPAAKISDNTGASSCIKFLRQLAGRSLDMKEALAFARDWRATTPE
jgi:hypothetical protein